MRFADVRKNKRTYFFIHIAVVSACLLVNDALIHSAQAQVLTDSGGSIIGVTICDTQSSITMTNPQSDSIVTTSTVPLAGTVKQASQIEISIDDTFDSIITLNFGQTTYTGSVQVPNGTHTIKLTAVNSCPGPNGSASAVVTYEAPPQAPSAGSSTDTTVDGVSTPGVSAPGVGNSDMSIVEAPNSGLGFVGGALELLGNVARWLNIDYGSVDSTTVVTRMSTTQAVTFTLGLALIIIGAISVKLQYIAAVPIIASSVLPAGTLTGRVRFLRLVIVLLGMAIVFGSLFL